MTAKTTRWKIVLLAERRLGDMLAGMDRASRLDNLKTGPKSHDVTSGATLTDMGITKMQSSRWQVAARAT